jgi:hypothetical protein
MFPAYSSHAPHLALQAAFQRVVEVIIGSAVAVAVSYATAGMFRLSFLPGKSSARAADRVA